MDANESNISTEQGQTSLQGAAPAMVTAKQLQLAVADLQETSPGPGVVKVAICAVLYVAGLYAAMQSTSLAGFLLPGVFAGLVLAAMIITTHDALHHTLTGWAWFDELVPRLISWPIIWFHGTYAEVHKIHHKMNGDDPRDPERVQWTAEEYDQASALGKFYVRHQWFFDIFLLGGIGLILETVRAGLRFAKVSKSMRLALITDLLGILTANAVIYGIAIANGVALKWLCLWFILERCAGAVMQWRAHVEHYGLWGKGRHYFETQAYTCRNIRTNGFTSWYFNRLNFHSVHHAFPRVPFYLLGEAHKRFMELYGAAGGELLTEESGYLATSLRLARQPSVIGAVDESKASRRRQMVYL